MTSLVDIMSVTNYDQSYLIGFSFNQDNNSFFIEFYSKYGEKIENIPISLLKKFLAFNTNLGSTHKFYKICKGCESYHYESNYFNLINNFKNIRFLISKEYFSFYKNCNDDYKRFQLINDYEDNNSLLGCFEKTNKMY